MLKAIKYLDERIEQNIEKERNDNAKDVENILESQEMIDRIIIKNSDDILLIKKTKRGKLIRWTKKLIKLLRTVQIDNGWPTSRRIC